jgi:glutamate formiminotransferase
MSGAIVECVPNFSEGRDEATLRALEDAVMGVPGVVLLGREADADHNRSVFTMAGAPEAVKEAAVRAVGVAKERIDLRQQTGEHPRVGAADVVPFVPVEGMTLEECAALAVEAGEEIWRRHGVPVYFYEASARRPERRKLEDVRRGQFEGLREELARSGERAPDVGGPGLHESAGACVVGARKFLIAYNINLATERLEVAKAIAKKIRTSSGGLPNVKAMGVMLHSRRQAQVSMNLTDYEVTPPHVVFAAVEREAAAVGVSVASSELIGFVPKGAVEAAFSAMLRFENFRSGAVLENALLAKMAAKIKA